MCRPRPVLVFSVHVVRFFCQAMVASCGNSGSKGNSTQLSRATEKKSLATESPNTDHLSVMRRGRLQFGHGNSITSGHGKFGVLFISAPHLQHAVLCRTTLQRTSRFETDVDKSECNQAFCICTDESSAW